MDHRRATFHRVMLGCAGFVLCMLAILVYVHSRPQTASVQAAERATVLKCRERSVDPALTAIGRSAQADACREMTQQYVRKFGEQP